MSTKATNELLNFILHDTTTPFTSTFFPELISSDYFPAPATHPPENLVAEGGGVKKKKRRKRGARVCKNKQESETQRMTHIAVERNRRKQMNEHLAVLRSLLPESHVQRGDQASIVGGAIDFVKELEHLLQSLEAQKFRLTQQQQQQQQQQQEDPIIHDQNSNFTTNLLTECEVPQLPLYFHKLFSYPQYIWSQVPNNNTSISKTSMADIEVSLVQTHANLRILMRKRLFHLSKMVLFLQTCYLSILHLNVTTLDSFVLYSISLKVEEGCLLNSADDIAGVVHQMMLGLIEEEFWIHPNAIEQ